MDTESVFVRPADVFASPMLKSPQYRNNSNPWEMDERFTRYDSSPESMNSYTDDNTFSPIQEEVVEDSTELLGIIRSLLYPYHDQLDICTTFPFTLDALEKDLLTTYLYDYPETMFGHQLSLRPHPMAVAISVGMTNPASLHLILARSAQYRLGTHKFQSMKQQRALEMAVMKHKGEALQIVRNLSSQPLQGEQVEDLVTAITGLGLLERLSGAGDSAPIHFRATRQLLKSTGGPLQIQSMWVSRNLAHYECSLGSTKESYIWDRSDFVSLLNGLNQFFGNVWSFGRPSSAGPPHRRRDSDVSISSPQRQTSCLGLKPNSVLLESLSRKPLDPSNPTEQDRAEQILQLTCLAILCTILLDHESDPSAIEAYIDSVHELVVTSQLQGKPVNNIMWLLQIHDHSDAHTKRIWNAAGWVWVLRHVSFNVQSMVKDWLIAVLTGKMVHKPLKLDSFAFSYAS